MRLLEMENTIKIMLIGVETAILLFIISCMFLYAANDAAASNSFALYGLRMLVLFCYIAIAERLAALFKARKQSR